MVLRGLPIELYRGSLSPALLPDHGTGDWRLCSDIAAADFLAGELTRA